MNWTWTEVTDDPALTSLRTQCAQLYANTHASATVPQGLSLNTLTQLLAYSSDPDEKHKYNRYRRGPGDVRRVLYVHAGDCSGAMVVALFFNKMLRRVPPDERTLKGATAQHFWNVSIACETDPTDDIYNEVVKQCVAFRSRLEKNESFVILDGSVNVPVDQIVARLKADSYIGALEKPPYTMKEKDKEFLPWWPWGVEFGGSKNRRVPFLTLHF